ncbi:MFS transporter [Reyranella sp. CPCC 100927]|uniref:MFS transporter n=1 Tax=Reyranella sp. CPCC 100927 TaxID=2599616 RepID=UPI0011B5F4D0|nr:MFS transporter [Reyranella sp. CPCC 100927]TWT12788.1 MFS transporter [Reyranella sp. CPCC 100927]
MSAQTSTAATVNALPPYLFGLGAWFASFGIGMVMVQWIVAEILHQPADRLGLVQMCLMGPSILFMLWGGAVADHSDTRRQLLICHGLAALPSLGLGVLAATGHLSLGAMIVYGLATGTISAFAIPARDGLLPRVTSLPMPKAVAMATGAQFLFQLVGIALAIGADAIGAMPLLLLQSGIMLAGGIAISRLPPQPPIARAHGAPVGLAALWDGIRVVRESPQIWPVILLLIAVGLFYVATFMVVLPIAVRDVYGGGSARLALVNLLFWCGTIAASFAMMRLGATMRRRGRAIIFSLSSGIVVLFAVATLPSFPVLLALIFCWGMGAGVTMTQGRTIVQVATPASHRSRVLALFQLGFMGGAPIGAPIVGAMARSWSLSTAMWVACACMLCVIVVVAALSTIWRQELHAVEG